MAKKPSMFPFILGLVLLAGLVLLTFKEGFTEGLTNTTPAERQRKRHKRAKKREAEAKKQKAEAKKRAKEARQDAIDAAAEKAAQDKANEK